MKTIRIACQGAGTIPHTELVTFQGNLKSLSKENYAKLRGEILERGFSEPISVWQNEGNNYILNGHQRLRTLQTLQTEEDYEIPPIPVNFVYADSLSEAKHKVLSLASQYGSVEGQGLYEFLTDAEIQIDEVVESFHFPEIDLDDFKTEFYEDHTVEPAQCDEDEISEIVEPKTKLGDIYKLGNHRLMCGDSTSIDAVEKLMNGEKADMVFTDPPYGMKLDADYSKMPVSPTGAKPKKWDNIKGDHEDFSPELIQTLLGVFDYCPEILLCGADYFAEHIYKKNNGSWFVWDKRVTENFDRMIGSAFELIWSKNKHKREIARINNTLYSGESDAINKCHPTQKPIKLIEFFFERIKGINVVDLFGGSGSTLIACEKTNRRCFMMELDTKYCDVIVARWEKYTGKKAELI